MKERGEPKVASAQGKWSKPWHSWTWSKVLASGSVTEGLLDVPMPSSSPPTVDAWITSLEKNHFWKQCHHLQRLAHLAEELARSFLDSCSGERGCGREGEQHLQRCDMGQSGRRQHQVSTEWGGDRAASGPHLTLTFMGPWQGKCSMLFKPQLASCQMHLLPPLPLTDAHSWRSTRDRKDTVQNVPCVCFHQRSQMLSPGAAGLVPKPVFASKTGYCNHVIQLNNMQTN